MASESSSALDDPWRLLLEVAVFGAGAAALASVGRTRLAATLAVLAVAHLALTFALDQRDVAGARALAARGQTHPAGCFHTDT